MKIKTFIFDKNIVTSDDIDNSLNTYIEENQINLVDIRITVSSDLLLYTLVCAPAMPMVDIPIPAAGEEESTHVVLKG